MAGMVLRGFLKDVPSQLHSLRGGLSAADAPGVRMQAHALKGASATVAAEGLCAIAGAMERAGSAGHLDQCSELLLQAADEFRRLKTLWNSPDGPRFDSRHSFREDRRWSILTTNW
jgi:HPt (histidine-containing phosphotransfer) domain-containing protein